MQTVRIVEVGPRDGLQNESKEVPTAVKVELMKGMSSEQVGGSKNLGRGR